MSSDKDLWDEVAKTTKPLSPKARDTSATPTPARLKNTSATIPPSKPTKPKSPVSSTPLPRPRPPANTNPMGFDSRVLKDIKKGKKKIDARLDLHGLTQNEARKKILIFLENSRARDHRLLLIITGRGRDGEGVLHRNVPRWLSSPPFSPLVSHFEPAHDRHGGDGALYVQPRRIR